MFRLFPTNGKEHLAVNSKCDVDEVKDQNGARGIRQAKPKKKKTGLLRSQCR